MAFDEWQIGINKSGIQSYKQPKIQNNKNHTGITITVIMGDITQEKPDDLSNSVQVTLEPHETVRSYVAQHA